MTKILNYILIVVLVVAAVYLFHGITPFGAASATLVGETAPDFELKTYDGESIKLAELRGRVVLLTFWFPSCGYCRTELPHFETLANEYRDASLSVVAVETTGDNAAAKRFIRDSGLTFSFVEDALNEHGLSTALNYKIQQYPTAFIINREGTVHTHYLGYRPGQEKEIKHAIEHLLKE